MTTEQVEPVTEAGRALLADEWWTGDDTHIAFVREKILAIEAEALDVDRLARAIAHGEDVDARDEWWTTPRELAEDAAREYARLAKAVR